jgi:hypothetical protein
MVATGVGMPDMPLRPDGVTPGKYHGRVEYASSTPPAQITVTDSTSVPVTSATAPVLDVVEVVQATFNTATRVFTVEARSDDTVVNPALTVQGVPGVPTAVGVAPAVTGAMTAAQCTAAAITVANPADVCFTYTLPATIEPPEKISVVSAAAGGHGDEFVQLVGDPQNSPTPPVATDVPAPGYSVTSSGVTNLAPNLDLLAKIIQQPANGTVSLAAEQWIFTPKTGITGGPTLDSFKFVIQNPTPNNSPVSNLATANLTIGFTSAAPNTVADQFAAQANVARTLNVLANDRPASTDPVDLIKVGSVAIATQPANGIAVANADGTITYRATSSSTTGLADSFTYTVKNSATPAKTSAPTTVTMTDFTNAEAIAITKSDYRADKARWTVTGTTNWFGLNLTNLNTTCWLGATLSSTSLIGNSLIDATGAFQIVPVATAPAGTTGSSVRCQTMSGGLAASPAAVR